MFCRYCGNELADDAKFCNNCGKSLLEAPSPASSPQNGTAEKDSRVGPIPQEPAPAIKQSEATVVPKKKKRKMLLPAILAITAVAVIVIVFIERNSGNQDMVNRTIDYVSGLSEDQIVNYYGEYFGISKSTGGYILATNYSGADVTWSGNDVTIKWPMEIKIQSGEQPTYTVDITLNAETNFIRSHISHQNDWTYSFEVPDRSEINSALPESEDVVSMRTLFTAFDTNGITAINTYGGQYWNVSGIVGDIRTTYDGQTVVTFDYYYYAHNSDYSFDQMDANFIFADPSDPNLNALEKDKVAIITGYMGTSYNGYSLEFENCRVYGGEYSSDSYSYPNTADNLSDTNGHQEVDDGYYGDPNLSALPINRDYPLGYYEKNDGEGIEITYISDDDTISFGFFEAQGWYHGGQWMEPNFTISSDWFDITDDTWNLNVEGVSIQFFIYDSHITVNASGSFGGMSADAISGNYYCLEQAIDFQ